MSAKQQMKSGIKPSSIGLMYGRADAPTFASPTSFAEAFVAFPAIPKGVPKQRVLLQKLEDILAKAKDGASVDMNLDENPILKRYLVEEKDASPQLALETLRKWIINDKGTAKLLERPMVVPLNTRGSLISRSNYNLTSLEIAPRSIQPARKMTIVNGIAPQLSDAAKAEFRGDSSETASYSALQTNIFSPENEVDVAFWQELNDNARRQYQRSITYIDYSRAIALRALDLVWRTAPDRFTRPASDDREGYVFVPYTFDRNPALAFEAVMQKYAPLSVRKSVGLPAKETRTVQEIDAFILKQGNVLTSDAMKLLADGKAAQSVLRDERNFGTYWPIIQALVAHMHDEGRVYRGMTIEFAGTPYETLSLVYNFPKHVTSAKKTSAHSARILFGGKMDLPRVLYLLEDNGQRGSTTTTTLDAKFNPYDFVNQPEFKPKSGFHGMDWRSREIVYNVLCDPTDAVLKKAMGYEVAVSSAATLPSERRTDYLRAQVANQTRPAPAPGYDSKPI